MIHDHYSAPLSELDLQMVRAVPPGGNWRDIPENIPSRRLAQIRQTAAAGEGSRSTYYGRLVWSRPAYTISTYFNRPGNGCFIHPSADRLISIREAARLQSFPDSYRFRGPLRKRCTLVGNAVPPLLAYHLATLLPKGPVVDLFAGAGGMSLGFEWAGHIPVAAIDHDRDAIATLAANSFSAGGAIQVDLSDHIDEEAALHETANQLAGRNLNGLVGGPPCQGFSTAGNCLGDDPRNLLISVMLRWADKLRPRFVLLENVPAMTWRRHKSVLPQIHSEFSRLGYRSVSIVAHAEGYGVPQLRRRLFILAFEAGIKVAWPAPGFEIMEPAFLKLQPMKPSATPALPAISVADAISDLPTETTDALDDIATYASAPRSNYQSWARGVSRVADLLPPVETIEIPESEELALPLGQ